jgi:DNA-binding NtrC family response regulator
VIPLSLPPLRDRREDIPVLAQYFAEKYAAQMRSPLRGFARSFSIGCNRTHGRETCGNWRTFMRRVMTLSGTLDLDAGCFEMEFNGAARPMTLHRRCRHPLAGAPIREVERLHLESTLALTDGNRTHAAEMLGISLRTLRNKIREYGLPPRRYA